MAVDDQRAHHRTSISAPTRSRKRRRVASRRAVHVVERQIAHAVGPRHVPQRSPDHAARRIAGEDGARAGAAVGRDRCQPADVGEVRPNLPRFEAERHAGEEYAVEEPLEDRRIAEVPDREGQDEGVGGAQALDVAPNGFAIARSIVIGAAFLRPQDWIEPFGIEIAIVDGPVAAAKRRDDALMQRSAKALLTRMSEEDHRIHAQLSA